MAVTTMNSETSVHNCPKCSAQCAVAISEMDAAKASGKDIRISCHDCGDIFAPDNIAEVPPHRNPAPEQDGTALDIAICPDCHKEFSVPPLPTGMVALLTCPLCQVEISSDALDYKSPPANDDKFAPKKSGLTQSIRGLFIRKKSPKKPDAKKAQGKAAKDEATKTKATKAAASKPDNSSNVVTRLFANTGTTAPKTNAADDKAAKQKTETAPNSDTAPATKHDEQRSVKADKKQKLVKPSKAKKSGKVAILAALGVVIIGGAIATVMIIAPKKPLQLLEIFTAQQILPANFAITNAVYERAETSVGRSVVITVTIENTGQANGVPGAIMVELLDQNRTPILSWPVKTNALSIEAGESRAFVTRIFEPPSQFNDIQVTLTPN